MNGVAHLMMLCPALSVVGASDCLHIHKLYIITHNLMPPVRLKHMR